jgi:hypothetical protein
MLEPMYSEAIKAILRSSDSFVDKATGYWPLCIRKVEVQPESFQFRQVVSPSFANAHAIHHVAESKVFKNQFCKLDWEDSQRVDGLCR